MTHTFRVIYFSFPLSINPHVMYHTHTHPPHIPLHQFTHNSLAVMRHGEYQLSLHFDVQGVIFRVCSTTPFPPYHCISLSSYWLHLLHWGTGGEVPKGGGSLTHVCQLPQWLTDIFGLEWDGKGGVGCARAMGSCPHRAGERKQSPNSHTKVGKGSGQKGQRSLCQHTSQPRIATALAQLGLFSQQYWSSMKQHYRLIEREKEDKTVPMNIILNH